MVVIEVIFCSNSVKYETNFVFLLLLLLEMIEHEIFKAFPTTFHLCCHFTLLS